MEIEKFCLPDRFISFLSNRRDGNSLENYFSIFRSQIRLQEESSRPMILIFQGASIHVLCNPTWLARTRDRTEFSKFCVRKNKTKASPHLNKIFFCFARTSVLKGSMSTRFARKIKIRCRIDHISFKTRFFEKESSWKSLQGPRGCKSFFQLLKYDAFWPGGAHPIR